MLGIKITLSKQKMVKRHALTTMKAMYSYLARTRIHP
jgi:hypothetical protein